MLSIREQGEAGEFGGKGEVEGVQGERKRGREKGVRKKGERERGREVFLGGREERKSE